jgi:hypothetical protein
VPAFFSRICKHWPREAAVFREAAALKKNRCPGPLCARLPRHGTHCCPCRRPSWVAHPPGTERRACGGASIARGDADPRGRDNGHQATPQASKERRQGRCRRGEQAGSPSSARTSTAHSTGPVKTCGAPDQLGSRTGDCGFQRRLRSDGAVDKHTTLTGASGFTIRTAIDDGQSLG